jgi:hypothetical protein
MTQQAKMQ